MKKFFYILILSSLVFAESKRLLNPENLSNEKSKRDPKLYTQSDDSVAQPKGGEVLPNRVYGVYVESKGGWMFSMTNGHGAFAEPQELLTPGTVLPGKYIGAKNPLDRFKLNKEWKWEQTIEKEKHLLYVESDPPALKKVTYFIPDSKR